ncbi:hypothetical protein ACS0X6_38670, partial [Burkholderia gladioli]
MKLQQDVSLPAPFQVAKSAQLFADFFLIVWVRVETDEGFQDGYQLDRKRRGTAGHGRVVGLSRRLEERTDQPFRIRAWRRGIDGGVRMTGRARGASLAAGLVRPRAA